MRRGRVNPTWEHRLFLAACLEQESSSDSESLSKMVQMARQSSSSFSTCCWCWSSRTGNKDPEQMQYGDQMPVRMSQESLDILRH